MRFQNNVISVINTINTREQLNLKFEYYRNVIQPGDEENNIKNIWINNNDENTFSEPNRDLWLKTRHNKEEENRLTPNDVLNLDNTIQFRQAIQHPDDVKKSLDNFKMSRKFTHFTTPRIYDIYDELNDTLPVNSYKIRKSPLFNDYIQEKSNHNINVGIKIPNAYKPRNNMLIYSGIKNYNKTETIESNSNNFNTNNIRIDDNVRRMNMNTVGIEFPNNRDVNMASNRDGKASEINDLNKDLSDVLKRQSELVEEIKTLLDEDELRLGINKVHTDFNEVLAAVKEKTKNSSSVNENVINDIHFRADDQNVNQSNMLAPVFVDESAVKEALKNDPLVRRVLDNANKKKHEYFEKIKARGNKNVQKSIVDKKKAV